MKHLAAKMIMQIFILVMKLNCVYTSDSCVYQSFYQQIEI